MTDQARGDTAYTASAGWRWSLGLLGATVAFTAALGVWYFATGHEFRSDIQQAVMIVLCLFFASYGLYCAVRACSSAMVVLRADALLVPGLLRTRAISRSNIVGYRIRPYQGIDVLEIDYQRRGRRIHKARIGLMFKRDAAFNAWLAALPNLDAAELAASERELREDERLGNSPKQRLMKAERARQFAQGANILLPVAGAWVFFYPRPYLLLIGVLAALPPLALWLCQRYPGLFSIDDTGKKTLRAELLPLLLAPGFLLSLRALQDVQLLRPMQLLLPACAGLVLTTACILWVAPSYRSRVGKTLLVSILMVAYPASVLSLANTMFDRAAPERKALAVLDKHRTSGKRPSYVLTLPSGAASAVSLEAEVSPSLYGAVQPGQSVCFVLSPGAFGWPWYRVELADACTN